MGSWVGEQRSASVTIRFCNPYLFYSPAHCNMEAEAARKFVWEGAIPLQIHLHDSEVTTFPPPSPVMILPPRIGYLPLLIAQIKPHFAGALPPGQDTIWFDFNGLPLRWYIPTAALFDLLCPEPHRPWNITVHFRGYPGNILTPCDGEDSVKWSFINSLKEAAYIRNGNCKNIMSMSQSDQVEIWCSVLNSTLGNYLKISYKLKLGTVEDQFTANMNAQEKMGDRDNSASMRTGRIPVRLYVRRVRNDFDKLEDAPLVDNWDSISYINQPVEYHKPEDMGKYFSLRDAVESLLSEFSVIKDIMDGENVIEREDDERLCLAEASNAQSSKDGAEKLDDPVIKLIRVQGIEPKLEIPFSWVVNNLMNPDYFVHICVWVYSCRIESKD